MGQTLRFPAETCWIIRRIFRGRPQYHKVGTLWAYDPAEATIYREEMDAIQIVTTNRSTLNHRRTFGRMAIVEAVPLEGAILRYSLDMVKR